MSQTQNFFLVMYVFLFYALKVLFPRDTQSLRQFSNDFVMEQYTRIKKRLNMYVSQRWL